MFFILIFNIFLTIGMRARLICKINSFVIYRYTDCVPVMYIDLCSTIDHSCVYVIYYFLMMNKRFHVMSEISVRHICT